MITGRLIARFRRKPGRVWQRAQDGAHHNAQPDHPQTNDVVIPTSEGQALYQRCGAADKRLVTIPGAGHNDLLFIGRARYFEAAAAFV
jgi:alpha-beta hydrolase superfamily lysophospholipase